MKKLISNAIRILLIEDDPGDADLLQEMLREEKALSSSVEWATDLQKGLDCLLGGYYDVVLLDLILPDSEGLETFTKVQAQVSNIPIVVLTGMDDEKLALEAVRKGAQDYLVKGHVDGHVLSRVIRYAMERYRMQAALRSLSLNDDLTGLYNRRGFMTLAEQHRKLAQRDKRGFLLFLADVDRLKKINDQYGHLEGDNAIKMAAEALRETFRKSDIISRIGGDEFAIIAAESSVDGAKIYEARLQETLKRFNAQKACPSILSISLGFAYFDPHESSSISDLIAKADSLLYKDKHAHHLDLTSGTRPPAGLGDKDPRVGPDDVPRNR